MHGLLYWGLPLLCMKIAEFQTKIQKEIDQRLHIVRNPNVDDAAGVYLDDFYTGVMVPPGEIWEHATDLYADKWGHRYRTIPEALRDIKNKLKAINNKKKIHEKTRHFYNN